MTDIVVSDQNQSTALIAVIERIASNPDADISKLSAMLDMQERILDRNAKQQFTADLASMQIELPRVMEHGTLEVKKEGRTIQSSKFAKLEDINDAIRPVLQKYGFAVTFRIKPEPPLMWITTVLSHRDGHSEETSIPLALDTSGSKNAVQAVGSTISYGKRYGICAMLNISTGDDVDGQGLAANKEPPKQPITDSRLTKAIEKINAGEYTVDRLHAAYALNDDQLGRVMAEVQS
jgi:hypothetical protein